MEFRKETAVFQITNMELYQENGHFYAKVKARGEDKKGVWELEIPKMTSGLSVGDYVTVEDVYNPYINLEPERRIIINGREYNAEKAFDEQTKCNIIYKAVLIEPRIVDMSIEEIEEKLGHKIRIVDKKEEK